MAKSKIAYVCQECGAESPKWVGKCPYCNNWNTYKEFKVANKKLSRAEIDSASKPVLLNEIESSTSSRVTTGIDEFDRVLGGGIVNGALILIGGEPGIGKSTLALQMVLKLADRKCLYVSGEESLSQIKIRSERMAESSSGTLFLSEYNIEKIIQHSKDVQPDLLVIDSIQTVFSENVDSFAGSVTQIRESTAILMAYAKQSQVPVILIGHITKDGSIAGPKLLEHMVDVVLQFEGDQQNLYRVLRAHKNRFGSTSEIGLFEMVSSGLREVVNPSEIFFSNSSESYSGVANSSVLDGNRSFLIEVQALVSTATYGTPQRVANGYDNRRLNMLLAILEKRAGLKLSIKDVFLNIAGGLKVADPAIDLAVAASIVSSYLDQSIEKKAVFSGELSLTGEIRPVVKTELRIAEAKRIGMETFYISGKSGKIDSSFCNHMNDIQQLIKSIF